MMDVRPFMFDGTTLKPSQALAKRAVEALDDGATVVMLDESRVNTSRSRQDDVAKYLVEMGFSAKVSEADSTAASAQTESAEEEPAEK